MECASWFDHCVEQVLDIDVSALRRGSREGPHPHANPGLPSNSSAMARAAVADGSADADASAATREDASPARRNLSAQAGRRGLCGLSSFLCCCTLASGVRAMVVLEFLVAVCFSLEAAFALLAWRSKDEIDQQLMEDLRESQPSNSGFEPVAVKIQIANSIIDTASLAAPLMMVTALGSFFFVCVGLKAANYAHSGAARLYCQWRVALCGLTTISVAIIEARAALLILVIYVYFVLVARSFWLELGGDEVPPGLRTASQPMPATTMPAHDSTAARRSDRRRNQTGAPKSPRRATQEAELRAMLSDNV